jgi:hypothetical protein
MDGAIQSRTTTATGAFSTLDWPARRPAKFFSSGFWAVALLSGIGLAVSLGLSFASPCTGIDLNIGCVPIEMTGQVAE